MMRRISRSILAISVLLALSTVPSQVFCAEDEVIPFDAEHWTMPPGSKVVEYMGQTCLVGPAVLNDVEFENGVIEFDVAFKGLRTFAGVNFRVQSQGNQEVFYLRPHKSRLADALQYTPVINGMSAWQLYSGEGYTAAVEIPHNEWLHVKLVVSRTQGRVYLGGSETPALAIHDLKHGVSKGRISIFNQANELAHIANFKCRQDNSIDLGKPPRVYTPPGLISDWEISQAFGISATDRQVYPDAEILSKVEWQAATGDATGLVNISRYLAKPSAEPAFIYARTTIESDAEKTMLLKFGYSDEVSLFLNGKAMFYGNSAFTSRDPLFQGIVGLNDAVYLPLKKGENELLLVIAEVFGGWGFICQDGNAVYLADGMRELWDIPLELKMPESAVYDPVTDAIYVSNYDMYGAAGMQFVSKITPAGKIEVLHWAKGLIRPTGLAAHGERLYAVDRRGVVEIDLNTGDIVKRHALPQARFPNDIAIADDGTIYVSDSFGGAIYSNAGGEFAVWLQGEGIGQPNGLACHDGKLIVGNNADGCLKAVDTATKEISVITEMGAGIIDGIQVDKDGNYLVAHYEGRIYRITPSGEMTTIVDRTAKGYNTADIEYVPEKDLLIVPSLQSFGLTAYELK